MMVTIVTKKVARKSASLLFLVLLFSSCSHTIKVRTPSTRFISPEAGGKLFASEVSGFYAGGTKASVNLKNERTTDPLVLDNETNIIDSIGLNANIGLHEKIDFVMTSGGANTPVLYGVKYQLIGKKRVESKKGDQSLAITIMAGNAGQTQKSGEDLELTAMDDDTEVELDRDSTDYSLIYGKRIQDTLLAYTGVSYTKTKISGVLQSQSVNLDGKSINYSAEAIGAHIGLISYISKFVSLKFEVSGQQVNWTHTEAETFGYVSGGMAFYWD
jgi:hypothetical protein